MDYYKLEGNSLTLAPSTIEKDGTTYINNTDVLKELGYKPLKKDETRKDNMISQGSTYTQDDDYIYEHINWKSLDEIQKEQEEYEKTRQYTQDEVIALVLKESINTYAIDDSDSLRMIAYYPSYNDLIGKTLDKDFKLEYQGKLYKVLQKHTVSKAWIPGNGTESLYAVVDESHKGTQDDPIPYEGNMALENGKYYTQDNVVYKCNRDTGNPVYNALKDLVGLYVEKVG